MNEKKQRIIEEGMKLFAKQGFHNTSIQEIADKSGVSKGGFYLYFKSKEGLILAIFKFYYEKTRERLLAVKEENLNPTKQLERQLEVYFDEFLQQREFILMQMRDNISINKELDAFLLMMRREMMLWYERAIDRIYGNRVQHHLVDCAVLLEGLLTSYIKVLLFDQITMDTKTLARFIINRLDDVVEGLIKENPEPLLTKEMLPLIYGSKSNTKEDVGQLLTEAEELVIALNMPKEKQEACLTTLHYLKDEMKKEEPQKVVFKGMLTNLKECKELDDIRVGIAKSLDISLL